MTDLNKTQIVSRNALNQSYLSKLSTNHNKTINKLSSDSLEREKQDEMIARRILTDKKYKSASNKIRLPKIRQLTQDIQNTSELLDSQRKSSYQDDSQQQIKKINNEKLKLNLVKFKRNFRVTSDYNEEDPDYLSQRLILENEDIKKTLQQIGVANLVDEIHQNESEGYVPPRTLSRMKRVRKITYDNFARNFIKTSNTAVVNVPPYLNYFEFRKNENTKQLAKDILKGDFNFEEEEEKLNKIMFNLLNRSEKFSFILQTKKEKKVNQAKFMSSMKEVKRRQSMLINESVDDLKWLKTSQEVDKLSKRKESIQKANQTSKFNINDIFENQETKRLLSDNWTQKQVRTISPSKKVIFITQNDQCTIPESEFSYSPNKADINYVKETVKDIVQKSQRKVKVNNKTFDEIHKIDKQKMKFGLGIGKFLDLQDSKKQQQNKQQKSIIDLIQETEFAKKQNIENFKSKEIVEKVKQENFENSVKMNFLGKGKIWKPDRSYLTSGRKSEIFNFQSFGNQSIIKKI
eukprot:403350860